MKYTLDIIPGTLEFVLDELLGKFPNISVIKKVKSKIIFDSNFSDIHEFHKLKSPLRITQENGLTNNLFRREWKKFHSPAGINPSLAYILCMIAEIDEEDVVMDPFCGAGTIAITACLYFNAYKVLSSDVSGKAVDFTQENIKKAEISKKKIFTFRSNVSQLKTAKASVDKVISNLPFGVRSGDHTKNEKYYHLLSNKMRLILAETGKLVLYTQEKELIRKFFQKPYYLIQREIVIKQGGLYPTIFVIQKSNGYNNS